MKNNREFNFSCAEVYEYSAFLCFIFYGAHVVGTSG
jgi:hypothetical protein